jgi:hypothetical protein
MDNPNNIAAKGILGFFNIVFYIGLIVAVGVTKFGFEGGLLGVIGGCIFLIILGITYSKSKKYAKNNPKENGPAIFKGFLITNGIVTIISIIILAMPVYRRIKKY